MIEIARILKPHGIRGELKLRLFSENYDAFCKRGYAYLKKDGGYERAAYTAVRVDAPFIYVRFDGIATRNDAEAISGQSLFLRREDLEPPAEGEYYIVDLLGLKVVADGETLGTLEDVLQYGAADVYVVRGAKNFMFPALKRVIQSVDLDAGQLRVDRAALAEVAVYEDL